MRSSLLTASAFVAALGLASHASPVSLDRRQVGPDLQIWLTNETDFCLIFPRDKGTTIGASERPGGMKARCLKPYSPLQGRMDQALFTHIAIDRSNGRNGARRIKLTACIDPTKSSYLVPSDDGGQYDSSGGDGGRGNPEGSLCIGYNHYVQLFEPAGRRACLMCCDDGADCPTNMDTQGCGAVIPGDYNGC